MITLLKRLSSRSSGRMDALLDITLKDFDNPTQDLLDSLKEAKANGRNVTHQFGGDAYFLYDPANQTQVEVALSTASLLPSPQLHVESTGARGSWESD